MEPGRYADSVSLVLEVFVVVDARRSPLTRSGDRLPSGCGSLGGNLNAVGGSIAQESVIQRVVAVYTRRYD